MTDRYHARRHATMNAATRRTTRDLCQDCWQDAHPNDYAPTATRHGPCAECGAEALVTRSTIVDEDWPMHPADRAAERATIAAQRWGAAKRAGDDAERVAALRAYRAARLAGRAYARDERAPTAAETVGDDAADWIDGAPRPGTVYRLHEGGDLPTWALCAECIAEVRRATADDPDSGIGDGRYIAGPTAATCDGCGLDGAGARWAEALRGADLWRALLVGLDGTEVDPLTGNPWHEWGEIRTTLDGPDASPSLTPTPHPGIAHAGPVRTWGAWLLPMAGDAARWSRSQAARR